ncbi:MAG: ATP-binding cassette domain-containing protein [Hydrotalea flava]|nr:ATP-binding cassette domain-containing protein [Hydrotalea flava]NIM37367.1 ATP-binding cassette domain-containing protein [Hydrotalea flava]NIN02552.1 ATP-binding cassette domain-containing protein [Hydrotalea flava]NIN14212.1 ATP-binding cassette domain-containing protein [Hydrotalea flava]NIO93293.1 ATP-binding cassette domain-containing protein [Hydrotalea flava]
MQNTILEAVNIVKYFYDPVKVKVLNGVNFAINRGDFVSIVGKSGCGKSSLLYVLSTMDTDYEGDVLIDGISMQQKKEAYLAKVRNEKIGFVFQFHYLLNEFTVLKNVMLPGLKLRKYTEKEVEARAYEKLQTLGIADLALKNAARLSGGEKQRVAIARSLINDPDIIMGDEPTGNLDKKNSELVFDIFKQLSHELNQTMLIVTHDPDFAAKTNRIIRMEDGRIVDG